MAYSFTPRPKFNGQRARVRYNLALDTVEENIEFRETRAALGIREAVQRLAVCANSPNPYSVIGTCKTVYNGINCPFSILCPPRYPKVYYNGTTGVYVGPSVSDIADYNPYSGVQDTSLNDFGAYPLY